MAMVCCENCRAPKEASDSNLGTECEGAGSMTDLGSGLQP